MLDKHKIEFKTSLIAMCICSFFLFFFMIIKKVAPFGCYSFANTDCFHQMLPLLAVFQHKIKNGDSLFYYWNCGGGSEFLSSYYYYLASPLNYFVIFIDKTSLNAFISITISIRIIMSAGTFGLFISDYDNTEAHNNILYGVDYFGVVLSCAYALSSFMCAYMYEIMWLDLLMVFPIILYGYKKLIRKKKPLFYILSLAYSLYCNYYISYMICVFLIVWFLLDDYGSLKDFISKLKIFILSSVLSAGLVANSLIVSFIGLMKTASKTRDIVNHSWFGNIFNIIRQQYIFSKPVITSYDDYDANLYCGSFVLFFLFLFIFMNNISIRRKIKRLLLIILLYICMNESVMNYVLHGFHKQHGVPNRFSFLLIVVLLITARESFNKIETNKPICTAVSIIMLMMFPLIGYSYVDFNGVLASHIIIFITYLLFFIYSTLILVQYYNKNNKKTEICKIIISIICLFEIIVNSFSILSSNLLYTDDIMCYLSGVDFIYNYVEKNDSELFYRSDRADGMTDNENAYYGMNGIGVFNSTVNKEINDFLYSMGQHTWKNRIVYSQTTEFINDIMGIKYIYAISGNNDYEDIYNYDKIFDDGVITYLNKNALSLGFCSDESIIDYKRKSEDKVSENINSFLTNLSGDEGKAVIDVIPQYNIEYLGCDISIEDSKDLKFQYVSKENENKFIKVSFDVVENGEYYLDIKEENEDYLSIKVNGESIKEGIWVTNGLNRLGNLNKGDKVEISISDNTGMAYQNNNMNSEVKVFLYKFDNEVLYETIDKLKLGCMKITNMQENKIIGDITLNENQVLFTTIPYDDGWHIYENGNEIEKIKIADSFIGARLEQGYHKLEFRYFPQGYVIGSVISFISIMLLICYIHFCKKRVKGDI